MYALLMTLKSRKTFYKMCCLQLEDKMKMQQAASATVIYHLNLTKVVPRNLRQQMTP